MAEFNLIENEKTSKLVVSIIELLRLVLAAAAGFLGGHTS